LIPASPTRERLQGEKPAYFNKEGLKLPSRHGGKIMTGFASRKSDDTTQESVRRRINPTKCPGTVWDYMMAGDKDPIKAAVPETAAHRPVQ
jgi:hypothetical protein